jgi:phosphohistidine phosphatase
LTKTLYLLRHAKSSWELAGELDWERGLLPRGFEDAAAIGQYMLEEDIAPEFIICSSARRAKQTLATIRESLPDDAEVLIADEAYQASTADLFNLISGVSSAFNSALLVGHNPSIHDFAVQLAAHGTQLDEMAGKFPTATLAELELTCDWNELAADCATLTGFTRPKTLR